MNTRPVVAEKEFCNNNLGHKQWYQHHQYSAALAQYISYLRKEEPATEDPDPATSACLAMHANYGKIILCIGMILQTLFMFVKNASE